MPNLQYMVMDKITNIEFRFNPLSLSPPPTSPQQLTYVTNYPVTQSELIQIYCRDFSKTPEATDLLPPSPCCCHNMYVYVIPKIITPSRNQFVKRRMRNLELPVCCYMQYQYDLMMFSKSQARVESRLRYLIRGNIFEPLVE